MFGNDISQRSHFTSKYDTETAYYEFIKRCYINAEDFPFKVKTGRLHAGKEVVFSVVSWGSYEVLNGWRVFVAYRFPSMKHTVQYTWHVGSGGLPVGKPEKNEWIN